jgi:hypothetical protein
MNATSKPNSALAIRETKFQDILADPDSVTILELDPSSSGNHLRGAGQLEFIDEEWRLALRHVHEDVLPYIKRLYVWFRVANEDFDIYDKLEELPTTIDDYNLRIRFLIAAIEDLDNSNVPEEMVQLKNTIVTFYKNDLEVAEKLYAATKDTKQRVTAA